jgi:DNA (cytosine-5)-methyltransferase 1
VRAYYNEVDPYAAAWLRNLISAGLVPAGDVDDRSICDVHSDDLRGYGQCHFFAGLGGWAYAARLAGWPDDRALWSGSCPCQPFSRASRVARGTADERHLWPAWFRLIRAVRPAVVVGEQVATSDGLGWWDGVADDLGGAGYACRAVVIPAAGVGAPHRRNRLWFVADDLRGGRAHGGAEPAHIDIGTGDPPPARAWSPEPAVGRLVHGVSSRVGPIGPFGNAIVPQVGAEVIAAFMEAMP